MREHALHVLTRLCEWHVRAYEPPSSLLALMIRDIPGQADALPEQPQPAPPGQSIGVLGTAEQAIHRAYLGRPLALIPQSELARKHHVGHSTLLGCRPLPIAARRLWPGWYGSQRLLLFLDGDQFLFLFHRNQRPGNLALLQVVVVRFIANGALNAGQRSRPSASAGPSSRRSGRDSTGHRWPDRQHLR